MSTSLQFNRGTSERSAQWPTVCGRDLPKDEVIYGCQVVLIYIVVIACLVNLSIGGDLLTLWSSLLSGSLGYLLPAPNLVHKKEAGLASAAAKDVTFLPDTPEQQQCEILRKKHAG